MGTGGQLGERLGDGPGSDQLCAHLRHVAHLALPAPLHKLRDELVELRCTQYTYWDRARLHGLLVGGLRHVIARGETVAPDDGHHYHPLHTGPLAGLVQVPGRSGEELRGRLLVGLLPQSSCVPA